MKEREIEQEGGQREREDSKVIYNGTTMDCQATQSCMCDIKIVIYLSVYLQVIISKKTQLHHYPSKC